jgi:hypothetical protein
MLNLFVYDSFTKGYVNHKYVKEYNHEKALLARYRSTIIQLKNAIKKHPSLMIY